jgi:hypothetical protein
MSAIFLALGAFFLKKHRKMFWAHVKKSPKIHQNMLAHDFGYILLLLKF